MIYIAKCLDENKEIYWSKSKKKTYDFAEKHAEETRHAVDVYQVDTTFRGEFKEGEISLDQFPKEQIKLIKRFEIK